MTQKNKKFVERTIRNWKPKLFLNEWFFNVHYENEQKTNLAEISVNYKYFEASVFIYPSFWELPDDQKEHTLVHELSHCLVEPLGALGHDLLNGKLVTTDTLDTAVEQLTQRIANIAFKDYWE